jgi:hypothetical protein
MGCIQSLHRRGIPTSMHRRGIPGKPTVFRELMKNRPPTDSNSRAYGTNRLAITNRTIIPSATGTSLKRKPITEF